MTVVHACSMSPRGSATRTYEPLENSSTEHGSTSKKCSVRSLSELRFSSNLATRRSLRVVTSPLSALAASESRWKAGSTLCWIKDSRMKLNRYSTPRCRIDGQQASKGAARGEIAVDARSAVERGEVTATSVLVDPSTSAQLRFGCRKNGRQSRKSQRDRDRMMDHGKSGGRRHGGARYRRDASRRTAAPEFSA